MILHDPPVLDLDWESYELARDSVRRYVWIWQGPNIRLLGILLDDPLRMNGYSHGWCYPRDPRVVAASVAAWDSDVQDEPTGWHKRPTSPVRRAPRRDEDPVYNRARCVHGCYLESGCRTVNCPEEIALRTGRARR